MVAKSYNAWLSRYSFTLANERYLYACKVRGRLPSFAASVRGEGRHSQNTYGIKRYLSLLKRSNLSAPKCDRSSCSSCMMRRVIPGTPKRV